MSQLEDSVEFARNPDPRCPCLLLLDTSSSMSGQKIAALNAGIQAFSADIEKDEMARRRCEVAIITFGNGGVSVQQPFITANQFEPPALVADGATPMGEAILKGVELLNARKAMYRRNTTPYYRPWLLLITDGMPTDHLWQNAARVVRQESDRNGLLFFPVGVEGADMAILEQIATPDRPPVMLKDVEFVKLFLWLSQSQKNVSRSSVGEKVTLPSIDGWASI
jgi:uncharacterized protein YegL